MIGLKWAFEHFYYADKMNACIHAAPVKFSPITFFLLDDLISSPMEWTPEMREVAEHRGQYVLDYGR